MKKEKFNTHLSQVLGDGEHHIRGRHQGIQSPGDLIADHLGQDHGDRLSQHDCLGLYSSHSPPDDPESADHRGVRVRANHGIRVDYVGIREADAGKVFQVDLVDNAGA